MWIFLLYWLELFSIGCWEYYFDKMEVIHYQTGKHHSWERIYCRQNKWTGSRFFRSHRPLVGGWGWDDNDWGKFDNETKLYVTYDF